MANFRRPAADVMASEIARVREILSSVHFRAHVWSAETLKAELNDYIGLDYTDAEIAAFLAGLRADGFLVQTPDEPTPPRLRSGRRP